MNKITSMKFSHKFYTMLKIREKPPHPLSIYVVVVVIVYQRIIKNTKYLENNNKEI